MELLDDIIAKVERIKWLVEIGCRSEAELLLMDAETMLDELPADMEAPSHLLLDMATLMADARLWFNRDRDHALEALDGVLERLRSANAEAGAMEPELATYFG